MNNLSWLIYSADVADGIGALIRSIVVFSSFGIIAGGIMWLMGQRDSDKSLCIASKRIVRVAVTTLIIFAFINVVIPSRATIIMIAASELGERVIASPQTQTVVDPSVNLLRIWIEQQTQKIRREMQQQH